MTYVTHEGKRYMKVSAMDPGSCRACDFHDGEGCIMNSSQVDCGFHSIYLLDTAPKEPIYLILHTEDEEIITTSYVTTQGLDHAKELAKKLQEQLIPLMGDHIVMIVETEDGKAIDNYNPKVVAKWKAVPVHTREFKEILVY